MKTEYAKTDMTADALIARAVRLPPGWRMNAARWAAVSDMFLVGMNTAISICETAGYLPHQTKREFQRSIKETK